MSTGKTAIRLQEETMAPMLTVIRGGLLSRCEQPPTIDNRLPWIVCLLLYAILSGIVWGVIIFCATAAFAHPIDDPCEPGQLSASGCQPPQAALGLDIPEFFAAVKGYWHCRRKVVSEDLVNYATCLGGLQELQAQLSLPVEEGHQGYLHYWDVIPQHPELDLPGNVPATTAQTAACMITRVNGWALWWDCYVRRAELSAQVSAAVHKPAPVCPRPRPRPRR